MKSKARRICRRSIRKIKHTNKENIRLLGWVRFKIKRLTEELASKKKWVLMYDKLIANAEAKLRVLEQRDRVLEQRDKKE